VKILNVLASLAPRYGGPSKTAPELAQALAARGHQVTIYTTNWDGPGELDVPLYQPVREKGVDVWYFPVQFPRFWAFAPGLIAALHNHVRDFDIVHVYSLYFSYGWFARINCRRYNVPFVIQPHGSLDPFLYKHHRWRKFIAEHAYENGNIRAASAILYNTEEEREIAQGAVRSRPSGIVPLGLNLAEYSHERPKGNFRRRHPETQGKELVVFLSRVNFKKGLDLLVTAFATVARERPNAHLVIAGPDNEGYGAKIREQCVKENIANRVTMAGVLSEDEKRDLFADGDVFALTSYTENFGVTILEALACGLPVVISDKVNIWREIDGAQAGKVVPCHPTEIAQALGALLDYENERRRLAENGRRLLREKFQWERVAEQQENFFKAVIDGDPPTSSFPAVTGGEPIMMGPPPTTAEDDE
jgi:glycosyltransferase involved in cell wall biosynthesis